MIITRKGNRQVKIMLYFVHEICMQNYYGVEAVKFICKACIKYVLLYQTYYKFIIRKKDDVSQISFFFRELLSVREY